MQGTVRWFNTIAGFGYIEQSNNTTKTAVNIFVYLKDVIAGGLPGLHEGQRLSFNLALGRGHQHAVNIQPLGSFAHA